MMKFIVNDIKAVYAKLQDDESRFIFQSRIMHFLDGDNEHLWKMVDKIFEKKYFAEETAELTKLKNSGLTIVFYGAGIVGANALNYFKRQSLIPDFFCDKNIDKQKHGYMDLPVISLQTLVENHKNAVVVITASSVHASEIKRELAEFGINRHVYNFFVNYEIIEYFDHGFIKAVENEIYIDCGVLNGNTIEAFFEFTDSKYKKIYGYEPDVTSYERTIKYLRKHKFERVELINKGVWSKTTVLSFVEKGDGGSHISESGTVKIPVTTIDETIGDDLVTFIKMDVEGAEFEALRGAAKTIQRYKPRLAICVYHKPEDILEIPLYIHSLVPEYKYFLRHNAIADAGTVLYAIME